MSWFLYWKIKVDIGGPVIMFPCWKKSYSQIVRSGMGPKWGLFIFAENWHVELFLFLAWSCRSIKAYSWRKYFLGEKYCFEIIGPKLPKLGQKWDFLNLTKIGKRSFCDFLHEVTVVWRHNIDLIEPFSKIVFFSFIGLERRVMDPKWDFSSFMKN